MQFVAALLLLLPVHALSASAAYGGGFCMDNVTGKLIGTGFAAVSSKTKAQCLGGSFKWCPFSNTTKTWEGFDYYWFSGCCRGKQGVRMIEDAGPEGWPTCKKGMDASKCTRMMWHDKWYADFIAPETSGYNYQVTPNEEIVDPNIYGGYVGKAPCVCEEDDPGCKVKKDGKCLVCETDKLCTKYEPVQLGINFFKLHTIDLKTSLMAFSAWIRQEWYDSRWYYDYQCYGGVDYFEVQGEAGNMENSVIWVPDIELYNNDSPIWKGSVGARGAQVYACWSGSPKRGGCGYVFYSRPGLLKALCKYQGIVKFPFDKASCELEFAPFHTDGRWQDVIARRKDGGAGWLGKPGSTAIAGLTAGSQYQDYVLTDVLVKRVVVFYDCCPNSPWPGVVYDIKFTRSTDYYTVALMLPGVMLVVLSWTSFWMDPAIGERLGYGITVILAQVTNSVTAAQMMPVCNEKTFMDYINIVHMCFGVLALLETGIVLHLYYQDADTWMEAIIPRWIRIFMKSRMYKFASGKKNFIGRKTKAAKAMQAPSAKKRASVVADAADSEEQLVRKQMYRQIFYLLDETHNMLLDIEEITEFGQIMTGGRFNKAKATTFMMSIDENWDGVLDLEEFVRFCDSHLVQTSDIMRFKQMTQGFLEVMDRKRASRVHMWQKRSTTLDIFARWLVPIGYFIFLGMMCSMDEASMSEKMMDIPKQFPIYIVGFIPMFGAMFLYSIVGCIYVMRFKRQDQQLSGNVAGTPLFRGFTMKSQKSTLSKGASNAEVSRDEASPLKDDVPEIVDTIDVSNSWEVIRIVPPGGSAQNNNNSAS